MLLKYLVGQYNKILQGYNFIMTFLIDWPMSVFFWLNYVHWFKRSRLHEKYFNRRFEIPIKIHCTFQVEWFNGNLILNASWNLCIEFILSLSALEQLKQLYLYYKNLYTIAYEWKQKPPDYNLFTLHTGTSICNLFDHSHETQGRSGQEEGGLHTLRRSVW